jgi:hypothetical protein
VLAGCLLCRGLVFRLLLVRRSLRTLGGMGPLFLGWGDRLRGEGEVLELVGLWLRHW